MSRYIDADAVVAWCNRTFQAQSTTQGKSYVNAFLTAVDSCPTADVVEVRHGEWIFDFTFDGDDFYKCSVCGRQEVLNGLCNDRNITTHLPYCHCGAKMDVGKSERR